MPIDLQDAQNEYSTRAPASSDKLVRKYLATPGKLDKASSPAAQKSFEDAMRDPNVLKRRQTNLRKLSENDLNQAMQAKGGSAYAAGVQAGAPKWGKNFQPYAGTIDATVSRMAPRTRDAAQNVTNRVLPLAKALQDQKNKAA